jgi:putative membrane protein
MITRKPTAFRLADGDVARVRPGETPEGAARIVVEETEDPFDAVPPGPPVPAARRGFSWGRLFLGAVGSLVALAVGLWIDDLVTSLFARNDGLGWVAVGVVALAGLSLLAIVVRELLGLASVARIDRLRREAEAAALADDRPGAVAVAATLSGLYERRIELSAARAALRRHDDDVIDGRDRLVLAEATLLAPLDEAAARLVSDAARRVSLITAVSPRAVVDLAFVFYTSLRLIREIAALYGGRPGVLRFARLTRLVLTHLAVTGSIAVGDGIAQQVIGHGLAARLSARLGEGVVNGMLTARVGLAAIDVCRPLPFLERRRPGVSEMMGNLVSGGGQ